MLQCWTARPAQASSSSQRTPQRLRTGIRIWQSVTSSAESTSNLTKQHACWTVPQLLFVEPPCCAAPAGKPAGRQLQLKLRRLLGSHRKVVELLCIAAGYAASCRMRYQGRCNGMVQRVVALRHCSKGLLAAKSGCKFVWVVDAFMSDAALLMVYAAVSLCCAGGHRRAHQSHVKLRLSLSLKFC